MPFTEPTATNGIITWFGYVNDVTNGFFWSGICIALWFVFYQSFKPFGNTRAMAGASWITTIFSFLLGTQNLVSGYIIGAGILLTAGSM